MEALVVCQLPRWEPHLRLSDASRYEPGCPPSRDVAVPSDVSPVATSSSSSDPACEWDPACESDPACEWEPACEWASRICSPCCLANSLTHWPMPCSSGPRLFLHLSTCCLTSWPQWKGFGSPVIAAFAPTPLPATRSVAVAATATLDLATAPRVCILRLLPTTGGRFA